MVEFKKLIYKEDHNIRNNLSCAEVIANSQQFWSCQIVYEKYLRKQM